MGGRDDGRGRHRRPAPLARRLGGRSRCYNTSAMAATESTGLNAAYVAQLHEDYLDSPASVPDEWRRIFEGDGNGSAAAPARDVTVSPDGRHRARGPCPRPSDRGSVAGARGRHTAVARRRAASGSAVRRHRRPGAARGVAAAMALVKAYRMHGHLAARLDPLGSEPMGDPALDESRLHPPLTPELQARIPARLLRLSVPGETLLEALPRLRDVYMGSSRVRDRAHLGSRRAGLAAKGDRVGALPPRADTGGADRAPAPPQPGGRLRALPPAVVPRAEAVLAGRARRARADARRDDRAGRRGRRARGRDRDGPPRPVERARRTRSGVRTSPCCASSRASAPTTPSSSTPRAAAAT